MRSRWELLRWVTVRQTRSNDCLPAEVACGQMQMWGARERRAAACYHTEARADCCWLSPLWSCDMKIFFTCLVTPERIGGVRLLTPEVKKVGSLKKAEAVVGRTELGQHCIHNMCCLVWKDLASWVESPFVTTKLYFPSLSFAQLLIANKLHKQRKLTQDAKIAFTLIDPWLIWSTLINHWLFKHNDLVSMSVLVSYHLQQTCFTSHLPACVRFVIGCSGSQLLLPWHLQHDEDAGSLS